MSKVSNKSEVIRTFMHREFPNILMVKFSDQAVHTSLHQSDAVLLFNNDSQLVGVNLLNTPYEYNGYTELNESLKSFIEKRFELLDLPIEIDQKSYFICGKILDTQPHPLSEHLQVCSVDVKNEVLSIVCSAKNIKEHMHVVVALPKAVLADGTMITEGIVAGVPSQGMMCSLSEITGGKKPIKGLIELPRSTECGSVLDIAGLGETLC